MHKHDQVSILLSTLAEGGTITAACKRAGVSRMFYDRHYKSDLGFRKKVDEARKIGLATNNDRVISAHTKKISEGSWPAIKYYLEHHVAPYKKKRAATASKPPHDGDAYELLMRDIYAAAREGNAQSQRLWLTERTQLEKKRTGSANSTVTPDDIRVLIDVLPQPLRDHYYDLLAQLLIDAGAAAQKNVLEAGEKRNSSAPNQRGPDDQSRV